MHFDGFFVGQILALDACSTTILSYFLSVLPMKNLMNNAIHIFNEVVILICAWYLLLFTPFVPSPIVRHTFASYFLYILAFNIGVNIIVLLSSICATIFRSLRAKYHKRQLQSKKRVRVAPILNGSTSTSTIQKKGGRRPIEGPGGTAEGSLQRGPVPATPELVEYEDSLAAGAERPSKEQERMYRSEQFLRGFQEFYDNMDAYDRRQPEVQEYLRCYKYLSLGTLKIEARQPEPAAHVALLSSRNDTRSMAVMAQQRRL